ncbi:MAG: hypothetical protein M1837_002943 [Sclerophora amabilis]|nr:MAG: hypothetical protein M1837_002943 [Sclerophora amabilis]
MSSYSKFNDKNNDSNPPPTYGSHHEFVDSPSSSSSKGKRSTTTSLTSLIEKKATASSSEEKQQVRRNQICSAHRDNNEAGKVGVESGLGLTDSGKKTKEGRSKEQGKSSSLLSRLFFGKGGSRRLGETSSAAADAATIKAQRELIARLVVKDEGEAGKLWEEVARLHYVLGYNEGELNNLRAELKKGELDSVQAEVRQLRSINAEQKQMYQARLDNLKSNAADQERRAASHVKLLEQFLDFQEEQIQYLRGRAGLAPIRLP